MCVLLEVFQCTNLQKLFNLTSPKYYYQSFPTQFKLFPYFIYIRIIVFIYFEANHFRMRVCGNTKEH